MSTDGSAPEALETFFTPDFTAYLPAKEEAIVAAAKKAPPSIFAVDMAASGLGTPPDWLFAAPEKYRAFGPMMMMNAAMRGMSVTDLIEQQLSQFNSSFNVVTAWSADGTPLRRENRHWVPGHQFSNSKLGPAPSDVMIISKMPWKDEDTSGRNFSGPSGKAWQLEFEKLGEQYGSWYVTNLLKWVPPLELKEIPKSFMVECVPIVYYELSVVRPKHIILMGADAIKIFYGDKEKVETHRFTTDTFNFLAPDGSILWSAKIYCTTHPVNACRDARSKKKFVDDCAYVAASKQGRLEDHTISTNYRVIDNIETLQRWVNDRIAADHKVFSIDCEWAGDDPMLDPSSNFLRSIQICWDIGSAVYLRMVNEKGEKFLANWPNKLIAETLRPIFARSGVRFVGHNIRADLPWLWHLGMTWPELEMAVINGHDTMLGSHIIDENSQHGLENVAIQCTPFGRYDTPLEIWKKEHPKLISGNFGYRYVPDEILIPYGCYDAEAPFWAYRQQEAILSRQHEECIATGKFYRMTDGIACTPYTLFYMVTMASQMAIFEMERNGLAVDVPRLEALIRTYHKARTILIDRLRIMLNWPEFNHRSIINIRTLLFNRQKFKDRNEKYVSPEGAKVFDLSPVKTTIKNGPEWERIVSQGKTHLYNPSTDKDTLQILYDRNKLAELRVLRSIKLVDQICKNFLREPTMDGDEEVFISGLRGLMFPDKRIRTTITQLIETGRYGSRRPNLQNIPSKQEKELKAILKECGLGDEFLKMRSCFISRPGTVLVSCDYKSAELVVMACFSKDKKMMEAVLNPLRDLHMETANSIFNLMLDLVNCTPAQLEEYKSKFKSDRIKAKGVNFGVPYGLGAPGLHMRLQAEGVESTVDEASEILHKHAEEYSTLHGFLESVASCVVLPPFYFQGVFGRRRHFLPSDDGSVVASQQREAKNFSIQNVVAEVLSISLFQLWCYKRQHPDAGFRMLLPVHDSIMFEVEPWYLREFVQVVKRCMTVMIPYLDVALDIDIEIGTRWSEDADIDELRRLGVAEADIQEYCLAEAA